MNKENEQKEIEAIYPLTYLQEGMLYHCILNSDPELYFEQYTCRLRGSLNIDAFRTAWDEMVKRHAILRTSFVWKNTEQMMQVVLKTALLPFRLLDWTALSKDEQENQLENLLDEDRKKGFKLNDAPLMNITVIKSSEEEYIFIWNHHHLIIDAWSQSILLKELFQFYEAFSRSENIHLEVPRPFRDFVMWLRNNKNNDSDEYWRKYLQDFHHPTPLPFEVKNPSGNGKYAQEFSFLSAGVSNRLNEFARKQGVTVSTILQCVWAILLSRYNDDDDVLFGMTTAGRPPELENAESIIGLFINTIPMRIRFRSSETFGEFVHRIQAELLESREFEYSSLVQIHSLSELPGETPLFRSIFVFENVPLEKKFTERLGSLRIADIKTSSKTNYPLVFVGVPGEKITIGFAYDTNLFTSWAIKTVLEQLAAIISSAVLSPEEKVSNLSILSEKEEKKIVTDWNSRFREDLKIRLLHEMYLTQVSLTPDNPAVTYEGMVLTFKELDEESNRLANYLRNKGIGAEDFVALYISRSIEMIVGILAVLKAGGAYVPIDPGYPEERVSYILQDARVKYLLSEEKLIQRLEVRPEGLICLDKDKAAIDASGALYPDVKLYPENAAYIIYTSGSTGKPKGVVVTHNGMCNLLESMKHGWGINSKSRIMQFASIAFDGSVPEIFLSLTSGAEMFIAPYDTVTSAEKVTEFIKENSISFFTFPPSLLAMLESESIAPGVTIVSAGEACPMQTAQKWSQRGKFINGYGPTEATVCCCWNEYQASAVTEFSSTFPIGRPFKNIKIYILDHFQRPVAPGIPGELYVSSPGLARGYLNRADLTAEKFVPDPFSDSAGARLYKTGDIAKYLSDGNIEFIGRNDSQVKIRGFRIEIPEIEAALINMSEIQNAAVLVKERTSGDRYLSAYLTSSDGTSLSSHKIRNYLSKKLPDYMIPSEYIFLKVFPFTSSGKLDRERLLKINPEKYLPEEGGKTLNHLEELLAVIWAEVLELPYVDIHSNFFDLGGHSLKAARVLSRIRKTLGANISLRDLFNNPTVHLLASRIEEGKSAALKNKHEGQILKSAKRSMGDKQFVLSFAQQRLWFLEQMSPDESIFNLPLALRLKGELNTEALKESLRQVVNRQESLRTVFISEKGEPFQSITESEDIEIQYIDLSDVQKSEAEEELRKTASSELRRRFNISGGVLFRFILVKMGSEENVLLTIMHHIITDGWSMTNFIQDLIHFYKSFTDNNILPLPELPIQYADYAEWQRGWFRADVAEEQFEYWKRELAGIKPLLELPADFSRPRVQTFNGANEKFIINKSLVEKLRTFCRKESVTPYIALLSVFQILLARLCDTADILVGSPVANRTSHETESLIGFFVNTVVMRANFNGNPNFKDVITSNRAKVLGAFAHQDLPFEQLVEKLQPERSLSYAPIFQAAFVYQNFVSSKYELPGLEANLIEVDSARTEYDITLTISEEYSGELIAYWEYNTDLFRENTALRMIEQFITLLENLLDNPNKSIWETRIMRPDEYDLIIKEWNSNRNKIPDDCCINHIFEKVVEKYPGQTAVTYSEIHNSKVISSGITYRELNERANRLANYLKRKGLKTENNVAVSIPRSIDLIVGILAVLKAGGVFMPLDPTYPKERLTFMLEDSKTGFLLTTEQIAKEQYNEFRGIAVEIDMEESLIQSEGSKNPGNVLFPESPAYIIYTSGSTGRPKGAMLSYMGLCNLSLFQHVLELDQDSRVLQFASPSFDAFIWELLMALLSGAKLDLIPQALASSADDIAKIIYYTGTTVVTLPPSILARLPEQNEIGESLLSSLKTIIVAGEKISVELANYWSERVKLLNGYGPTETTVCVSMHHFSEKLEDAIPIGRPVYNCELYVLDKHKNPVPVGIPGELYIGGAGLGWGYINNPALTAEKFLPNPFSSSKGERMYKSGDLVEYNEKGILEFIGRIDSQIKIHGLRIELGEIEAVMLEHPDILQAAVKVCDSNLTDGRLVGYLAGRSSQDIPDSELRRFLRKRLPDYMIPSLFIRLPEFPLTKSGKIDYKSLPSPDAEKPGIESKYVEPGNETEKKVIEILRQLLRIDRIGIHDNFFELGGHSLLITRFISRIRDEFGLDIPMRSIFEFPTVSEIASVIQQHDRNIISEKDKVEKVSRGDESILDLIREIENLPENDAQ